MKYDLTSFDIIFNDILRYGEPTSQQLTQLKNELNRFYSGNGRCKQVLFTRNTDRAFFGMCVYPHVTPNAVSDAFTSSKSKGRYNFDYMVEFDSKLFEELNGFTGSELTAILLHEVGHIAIDESNNAEVISDFVNEYITTKDTTISIKNVSNASELLRYAYIRTIQKLNSIFNKNQEEFRADRFAIDMGYGPSLESAFVKILKAKGSIAPTGKFNTLIWTLTTYKHLYQRKKFLIKCMDEVNEYTGSRLDRDMNNNLKKALSRVKISEGFIVSDRMEYIHEAFGKIKTSALRAIEDDAYVYEVRIKNIDNEIEAIDLLRDINNKINIVSDYLELEKNISDHEIRRWNMLLDKLRALREALSKSEAYKPKYYGLYVQMPITQRRY